VFKVSKQVSAVETLGHDKNNVGFKNELTDFVP
jgi:hypothetical protein